MSSCARPTSSWRRARKRTSAPPMRAARRPSASGAGNVASIVDESADLERRGPTDRASRRPSTTRRAARRRTASCSMPAIFDAMLAALARERRRAARRRRSASACKPRMLPDGKLSPRIASRKDAPHDRGDAPGLSARRCATPGFLMVDGDRRRPGPSVLGREALAGARALPRARFRRGGCASSSASTPTRAPAIRSACTRATSTRRLELGLDAAGRRA